MNQWTSKNLNDQTGKTILVTGANTGLGYETSLELAKKGAHVISTGRDENKLQEAALKIKKAVPEARIEVGIVDLASIQSITRFAEMFSIKHHKLDVLINNAGIMFPPAGKTADGFETQFGVNFIGHFVLTALLFPLLLKAENARVVTLSSIAHRNGFIDFNNLKLEKPYDKFREYGQSKVADLTFAIELQRRIDRAGLPVLSVAAHPGISKTELLRYDFPEMIENFNYMSANQGSFPALYAATENIAGGTYWGPDRQDEINGYPAPAFIAEYAKGEQIGKRLWEYAEHETGISFMLKQEIAQPGEK